MSMVEKQSLINAITIRFAEDFNLDIKRTRATLEDIFTQYHITISDESFCGENLTTDYLFKKFSDGKKAIGMEDRTLQQYKIAVNSLEQFSNKDLANVEPEDINLWLRDYGKTVTQVTLRSKYQLISSVYNFLFERRYIPHNPIAFTDAPKAEIIYKSPLSDLELESIKYACECLDDEKEKVRDMAIVHTFISTGCRVSELANMKIKDVDLDKKICIVHGKGKKQRPVVLTDRAVYRLKLYLETRGNLKENSPLFVPLRGEEHAMTKDGIEHIIHKLRVVSGVNNLTCHVFRRFYATELRRRNVPIQMIANSLGHANLNQINRYSLYGDAEMTTTIRSAM